MNGPAAENLAERLLAAGRHAEVLDVTAPHLAGEAPSETMLWLHAQALRALGRDEEALAVYRRSVAAYPRSSVAEHNVAAVAGDLERHEEAEAAARAAFAKGGQAPETWLTLGRALQAQGRFDDAIAAYREAIRRRPAFVDAHSALAQAIWTHTEDYPAASVAIDAAIAAMPGATPLRLVKSSLAFYAGDAAEAYAVIAAGPIATDARAQVAASRAALRLDPEAALKHAEAATAISPGRDSELARCEALLALGRAEEAAGVAERLRRPWPEDQQVLAALSTAWRLLGDARYRELYDYDALVRSYRIEAPPGWASLAAYLADLAASLTALHQVKGHPIGQSLRSGTQTAQNLRASTDPAIRALFEALDAPIRAHLAHLGQGGDAVRARNTGGYEMKGVWSVRLRPGGGRHVDHVHTHGWLSSAFYVNLPAAVEAGERQGWLKFGEPGAPTRPPLEPEHFVKPEPGLLVLFPSYMWHGTLPFSGGAPRLTVAFDLVPA